jgi:flavin-binding protein dodecin
LTRGIGSLCDDALTPSETGHDGAIHRAEDDLPPLRSVEVSQRVDGGVTALNVEMQTVVSISCTKNRHKSGIIEGTNPFQERNHSH